MVKMEIVNVGIPEDCNVVLGQAHFIKSVEDIYEAIMESGIAIKFGLAFCESSGKRLVRSEGNDPALVKKAEEEALRIGAGHCFIVFIKQGFPINILNRIKNVSEVASVYAATANSLKVVVASEGDGRGILGVIDGLKPLGIEGNEGREWRRDFLRKIGYKR
ncbi:MAG: adenosine-specific kinase [Candidatus Bilamarchaeaceae archaeon]